MSNDPNDIRMFEELLSVSAWHMEFNAEDDEIDLHALIVFHQASLGSADDVGFKLKLRKAKLEVFVPEDFEVYPETILQIKPRTGKQIRTEKKGTTAGFSISARLKNSGPSIDANAQGGANHERGVSTESSIETTIVNAQAGWNNKKVWWDFTSIDGSELEGPAWDDSQTERLVMVDKRSRQTREEHTKKQLNPPVEIKVMCTRDDLEIEIEKSVAEKFSGKKLAAVESYIRDLLVSKRLEFEGDLSIKDPNAKIELASGQATTRDR